jgi:glycerol kinase
MSEQYILGIDQSTSGTKGLLFDKSGSLVCRYDIPHSQIIDDRGWVEHDLIEIYLNTIVATGQVVEKSGVDKSQIIGVGISNQRETAAVWDKTTGEPVYNAIVWQCARGEDICRQITENCQSERVKEITGLPLSPYFSAAKIAWVLENCNIKDKQLCAGNIDSWLIYKLTGNFKTDYSNASRTQLFDLKDLNWSNEVCKFFGIDPSILPQVCDSDTCFGYTDFDGFFDSPIPIHAVMGDSHSALYGQGCHSPGMIKTTYGTGSSIMMNIGDASLMCDNGLVTSIAWGVSGKVDYVFEGNINYTGAVIKWLVDDLNLIKSPELSSEYALKANAEDETYIVPAFSGLSAPYWDSDARAMICGMSRTTGKAEIVRAAVECIAFQIMDVVNTMLETAGVVSKSLRADGGATKNKYLMQFQSDILDFPVLVSALEELSGTGVSYMAGIALGLYNKDKVFTQIKHTPFMPSMSCEKRHSKVCGWRRAIEMLLRK